MKKVILIAAFVLVAGVAAAETAATGSAPVSTSIWSKIGMGVLGGVIASMVGWMKNKDNTTGTQQPFDIKYMFATVVVGAIIGAVGAWQGFANVIDTMNWAEQSALWAAIVSGGEMLLKVIFRQASPHFADIWNILKSSK